jgi:hypothetical protein
MDKLPQESLGSKISWYSNISPKEATEKYKILV